MSNPSNTFSTIGTQSMVAHNVGMDAPPAAATRGRHRATVGPSLAAGLLGLAAYVLATAWYRIRDALTGDLVPDVADSELDVVRAALRSMTQELATIPAERAR